MTKQRKFDTAKELRVDPLEFPKVIEEPAKIPVGFRRFAVGEGISLSHDQQIYSASPEGWVDLPSGEDWYLPLIPAGVIKELFDEPQTKLA